MIQVIFNSENLTSCWGYNTNMENLDQLIAKFKEVKEELEKGKSMVGKMKGSGTTQLTSPKDMGRANMLHDAVSGAYQPAATPAKKLTGLDRIKAVSSEPIKKDENDTHLRPVNKLPGKPETGHTYDKYGYNITAPVPKVKPAGAHLEPVGGRVNSLGSQSPVGEKTVNERPSGAKTITAQTSTVTKSEASPKFTKTINVSSRPDTNMAMSCSEKLSLNKGGQWNIEPVKKVEELSKPSVSGAQHRAMEAAAHGHSTLGIPKSVGQDFSEADKGKHFGKDEDKKCSDCGMPTKTCKCSMKKAECGKCHSDPCECQTTGINVDKMDGGGPTGVGSGI